jgi:glycosyltransferase involved in cell wall biosynthesis
MNLLYFAPHQIWPANTGARLRDYHLARQLAACSSVTFVEMRGAGEESRIPPRDCGFARIVTIEKGRTYTASKLVLGLAGPTPVTILNCWSLRSATQLAEVLASSQFDTVQVEGVHLMQYLPVIRAAAGSPEIVVDWHNIESEGMSRYAENEGNWAKKIAARRTAQLIERAENKLLATCDTHTVTSERERQKLLARCPGADIQVIPNGVDAGYYSAREIAVACEYSNRANCQRSLLFVGSMDYHANIDAVAWFARTAWPEIARNHPHLHFTIVGRDPAPEVLALASDRIHVTGTVEDVRPYYSAAVAAVVPIRSGSGTRLKILEAMAAGLPVISTRLGAEGIAAEDNVHLLSANSGREFVAAAGLLVSSAETCMRLSQAAQALVCKTYDWSVIGKRLFAIHAEQVEFSAPRSLQKVS